MTETKSDQQLAVIWDDEEPQYLRTPILQFQQRYKWQVTTCQTPYSVISRVENMSDDDLSRSVLILDLMMPVIERDDEFTPEMTDNGMLTGLEVARKIRRRGKISKLKAVFFYSALSGQDLRSKVNEFIIEVKRDNPNQLIEFIQKSDVGFGELPEFIFEKVGGSDV